MAKTEITKKRIEEEVKNIVTNDIYARVDSFMNDVINAHYEGVFIESVDMDALDFAMLVDSDPDMRWDLYGLGDEIRMRAERYAYEWGH